MRLLLNFHKYSNKYRVIKIQEPKYCIYKYQNAPFTRYLNIKKNAKKVA